MSRKRRRIESDHLRGLVINHEQCRTAAPSTSTGVMVHTGEPYPENEVCYWFVKFECSVCHITFGINHPKHHDLIRWALAENGIEAVD